MSAIGKKTVIYSSVYTHGVDAKRRLSVPAKWRNPDETGEETFTLMVWKKSANEEACLMALSNEMMDQLIAKLRASALGDPKAEALRRILGGQSDQVTVDKAGRVCLPELLARTAGIESEVVMVGMVDCFQIWNPARYQAKTTSDEALREVAYQMI